ncbi:unnamed protein product [Parascedosporium putredinis]|uniref:Spp2/MOS2 G-patch domain-containing protein n=1 Tax=Parascedosporium putredinis TaxID=1442378 RepID=A0A9P1MDR7_9PEZI|nr:unnamed protein product [Parascedosporium putredinis]CAI8003147.1 unnamed protein product [Parascedosporium putredinis]
MSIKFGSSDAAPPSRRRASPSSTLGKRPRTNALGDDSDSGSGSDRKGPGWEEAGSPRRGEEIIELGDTPKIIQLPEQSLRNKMRSRVQPRKEPAPGGGSSSNKEVEPADQDKPIQWGLTVTKKADKARDAAPEGSKKDTERRKEEVPRTIEQEAIDRLTGKTRDKPDKRPSRFLTADNGIDVGEFGAAMLRGMGWNGEFSRPGFKDVRRRPNQLGLGAKELKDAEDLGGWDHKGGKGGSSKPKRLADYNREKAKERESRGRDKDSYKRDREREREYERDGRHGRHDRDDRHYHSRR